MYALVSKGYKPGGFNHAITTSIESEPYKPENAWNYEVGVRTSLFDQRLDLGIAAYHIRTTDKQLYTGSFHGQVLRNAGKGTSTGVELEAVWRPTDQLTLTAIGNFGRSKFTDFTDAFSGITYNGNRVPYAPDYSGRISAKYDFGQQVWGADVSLLAGANFVGKTWFNESNTIGQDAYVTFDASVSLKFENGLTATVFADNITDEIIKTATFDFGGGDVRSTIAKGRTIGATLRAQF